MQKYKYTNDLDLEPGSLLHDELVDEIVGRAMKCRSDMSSRYDDWNSVDETLRSYIVLDQQELQRKSEDKRVPVSVVLPMSFAVLETLLTYTMDTLLSGTIFKYDWVGPEDMGGAMLLQKIIDTHVRKNKIILELLYCCRDAFAYGFGVGIPFWEEQKGKIPQVVDGERSFREGIIFEGNNFTCIDPYNYIFDTSIPVHKPQECEYLGWVEMSSLNKLLEEQYDKESKLFNIDYLLDEENSCVGQSYFHGTSRQNFNGEENNNSTYTTPVSVLHLFVNLIPSRWNLSDSNKPEKWYFKVAGDKYLIYAQKLKVINDKYPIAVCCPSFDGHSIGPISKLEHLQGLQDAANYIFNAGIENTKQLVDKKVLVDPMRVNVADLKTKGQTYVRLRPQAFNKGVEGCIAEIKQADITSTVFANVRNIFEMGNQLSATPEHMMGLLELTKERRSASEFVGTKNSATSRLEAIATLISIQLLQSVGAAFADNVQQYMSKPTYVKITGSTEENFKKIYGDSIEADRVLVHPEDIMVGYDILPYSGKAVGSEQAELWLKLFSIIAPNELVAQQFNLPKMVEHIATLLGAENIASFIVAPDQQVAQMKEAGLQQGNLPQAEQMQEPQAPV